MRPILSAAKAVVEFRFRRRSSLELEIIALRHQIKVLKKGQSRRVEMGVFDRLLWIILYRIWPKIVEHVVVVRPNTVVDWHYRGFRIFWRYGSRKFRGPAPISIEARDLIYMLKRDNPLWGQKRIANEIRKLGYKVSAGSVYRYLQKKGCPPSPSPDGGHF